MKTKSETSPLEAEIIDILKKEKKIMPQWVIQEKLGLSSYLISQACISLAKAGKINRWKEGRKYWICLPGKGESIPSGTKKIDIKVHEDKLGYLREIIETQENTLRAYNKTIDELTAKLRECENRTDKPADCRDIRDERDWLRGIVENMVVMEGVVGGNMK